jgi:hypothetical protein
MSKEKEVIDEIKGKAEDFETNMVSFLSECGEWADIFKVKPPKRKDHTFSNPRQTEFFRAASVVGTLTYRMMTAADPFFGIMPVDMNADYDKLDTLTHVWKTQLKYTDYNANLMRACLFAPVFGTVICQEDYRVIGVNPLGRKIPATVLIPRVLDQVMFDRATINIDEANWLATADITSTVDLKRLANEAKQLGTPWNEKALEAAANDKEEKNTINQQVLDRIRRSGFTTDEALGKKKELLMYYGKLDTMNDGVEYVCALVNRKYLVRFHANNFQHGRRPFQVAKWVDFDNSLGYGMGSILGQTHRAMDANRQKAQDLFSFGAYNMWKRRRNTVADEDLIIRPIQVVDVDNMDDIQPLSPDLRGADGILRLDEFLKQEFRAASGASDTLQAISSDAASATASALSQNEAIRSASVRAEHMAQPLVRKFLENNHWNNVQNIRAPFNINAAKVAKRVYPSDMYIDLEIEAIITSDKDFKPQQLDKLIQALQIIVSTKSNHPDQMNVSVLPMIKKIAYLLDVPPNEVVMPMGGMGGMPAPGQMPMLGMGGMAPMMGGGGGVGMVGTPVGQALVA